MATQYAVRMALCIECSPAVQEVPGSIPRRDATFSDALCKGCRWLWSSLYSTCSFCFQQVSESQCKTAYLVSFTGGRHHLNWGHQPLPPEPKGWGHTTMGVGGPRFGRLEKKRNWHVATRQEFSHIKIFKQKHRSWVKEQIFSQRWA